MTSSDKRSSRGTWTPPQGVFTDPQIVDDILASMDLSAIELEEAALVGVRAYIECTPHDPRHLPGSLLSGKAFRGLGDILVPRGWRREDRRGHSTVVSPDGAVAITTALGDENTGIAQATPETSASKGAETAAFISGTQLSLFPPASTDIAITTQSAVRTGWVLLLHPFDRDQRVNLELSMPEHQGRGGRISAWYTRLILPAISFDDSPARLGAPVPPPAPQRPVHVERRSS